MAKNKKVSMFFCKECGTESTKWLGQCPGCKAWNTLVEAPVYSTSYSQVGRQSVSAGFAVPKALRLDEIASQSEERMDSGSKELNRVLGGGIVKGSLVLVGGDPGIGKSTLLLQTCKHLAQAGQDVLYISGEESLSQIKLRADRMGQFSGNLTFLAETNLDVIETKLQSEKLQVVIIDSIQTMFKESVSSAPGSITQVREATSVMLRLAKGLNIAIFIVGHVTKEGTVAGPRMLEHMVDTVLYFEGERTVAYRILRAVKNRFGSTNEIGVFEMDETGLVEVENPSEMLLNGRPEDTSGSVVTCSMEGSRPILLEVQALVCRTNFGMPRRTSAGMDYNRVNLLLAVLEKRMGMPFGQCDAYINVAGGMKISEPSLDLAIVIALVSSFNDYPIDSKTLVFGEVGLTGEVRAVNMAERRVDEAIKLGFTTCILPKVCLKRVKNKEGIKLIGVENIAQAIRAIKE
ncbi:DNA repair protein RadA [Lachnospiraceae bacterium TWA4]|nr:DNA repair protein RadA [Lachnospiraceae bacterium TWA4]